MPEESCISCRVAEGYGPDEATATGSGENPDCLVPSPARFAGDMRCGGGFSPHPPNPDEAFFWRAGPSAASMEKNDGITHLFRPFGYYTSGPTGHCCDGALSG